MAPQRLRKVVERDKVSTFDRQADRRLAVCLVRRFCRELTASLQAAKARLAQAVEHETLNLRVVGSSPTLGVVFSHSPWSESRLCQRPNSPRNSTRSLMQGAASRMLSERSTI